MCALRQLEVTSEASKLRSRQLGLQVEKLQTRQMHARMHAQALRDEQQYHQQAIAERFTRKTTEEILREQQRAERAAREDQYDKANVARAKGEMENRRAANAEHQDQYQRQIFQWTFH